MVINLFISDFIFKFIFKMRKSYVVIKTCVL